MKTPMLAAVLAVATLSPASAVDVEFYNTNETFARKIGSLYEKAPAALKAKMLGAKVIAAGDTATFYKVQMAHGASQKLASQFSNGTYVAVAWQSNRSMARTLTFVQEKVDNQVEEYKRCVVLHEMAHLWDFGPKSQANSISDSRSFLRAFKEDQETFAYYVKTTPKDREELTSMLGYYFSKPQEAFAESAARALCGDGLMSSRFKYNQQIFEMFLPNIYAHVRGLMQRAGMLNENPKQVEVPYSKSVVRDVINNAIDSAKPAPRWMSLPNQGSPTFTKESQRSSNTYSQ
jgi:hypothetical protein